MCLKHYIHQRSFGVIKGQKKSAYTDIHLCDDHSSSTYYKVKMNEAEAKSTPATIPTVPLNIQFLRSMGDALMESHSNSNPDPILIFNKKIKMC